MIHRSLFSLLNYSECLEQTTVDLRVNMFGWLVWGVIMFFILARQGLIKLGPTLRTYFEPLQSIIREAELELADF